ncbi:hypothetical protein ACFQU2_01620 [Siccirubricoccus deserti]
MAGADHPVAAAGLQLGQEAGGVAGIGQRVEGLLQAGEGVGVVAQIDLQAANVDRAHPGCLQLPHRGNRCRLVREKLPRPRH